MNAEILCVGTELLLGDILNSNAQYLSRELAALGINVFYQTVVGDNPTRLKEAYRIAFDRADAVITSGGLGPTDDDLTKDIAAEYFGKGLELHNESWERIQAHFVGRKINITPNNKKQAMIIEGATVLQNDNGTAPGIFYEDTSEGNTKTLIMLPGPPNELIPMFENRVKPLLEERTSDKLTSRVLKVCGIGESALEDMISDIMRTQTNPTIALYAKTSEVWIRITAKTQRKASDNSSVGSDPDAMALIAPVEEQIRQRIGANVYGTDNDSLASVVLDALAKQGKTLACAESCTGGMLTSRLVDIPGASKVLKESCVTYSNEAKEVRLGVKHQTLSMYGAVSEQTAAEMADGIVRTSGADAGISITGIAGGEPIVGTEASVAKASGVTEKPNGLVYIGICIWEKDNLNVTVTEHHFTGNRDKIRSRAVVTALDLLRRRIQGE